MFRISYPKKSYSSVETLIIAGTLRFIKGSTTNVASYVAPTTSRKRKTKFSIISFILILVIFFNNFFVAAKKMFRKKYDCQIGSQNDPRNKKKLRTIPASK